MSLFGRNIGPLANFYPPSKRPMARCPSVILVQGFATSPRSLEVMVRHLEAAGLPCAIPSLGGIRGLWQTARVARAGAELARYLRTLPKDVRPWLIGHSIGGIIARYAIQSEGVSDRVSGLITIGAPHRGTPIAIAGLAIGLGLISRAPFDITPVSRVVRRLNRTPWPTDLPLVSLVSPSDLFCPVTFGTPKFDASDQVRTVVLPKLGHTEMVRTGWVLDGILSLMNDPSAPVSPAD